MSLPFSVFGIALVAAGLYTLFQKTAPTFALLLSLGAVLILLTRIGSTFSTVLMGLHQLERQAGGEAFSCLLRSTGIALLTDYTRTLCEEAGAESLAWCVGLAGRCLILAAAWPLLSEIGQRIWSIAG